MEIQESEADLVARFFYLVHPKTRSVGPNIEDHLSVDLGFFRAIVIDPNPPAKPNSSRSMSCLWTMSREGK